MTIAGGEPSVPHDIMLGLSWKAIDALVKARQVVHEVCGAEYIPHASIGPNSLMLQVIVRGLEKRIELTVRLNADGWLIKHEPEEFILYSLSMT